jgi:hypothetical protein
MDESPEKSINPAEGDVASNLFMQVLIEQKWKITSRLTMEPTFSGSYLLVIGVGSPMGNTHFSGRKSWGNHPKVVPNRLFGHAHGYLPIWGQIPFAHKGSDTVCPAGSGKEES